jgi:LuxR family maltose regulon positive regulatory protein
LVAKVLKEDQLFLSVVDSNEASPWFRFLPLFAELLQERLIRTDPGILPLLHEKAAKWFADRGFVLEAIYHARSSPGSTQLEALLDKVPIELRSLRWADAIRDMLSDVDPSSFQSRRAKVIGAWTLFAGGSVRRGEAWAKQVIAEDPGDDANFALHQQALKATLAFFHDDSPVFFSLYEALPADACKASILRHGVTTEAMTFLNALGRYEEVRDFVTSRILKDEHNDEWALFVQAFGAISYLNEGDIYEGLGQLKLIMERATAAHGDRSIAVAFCATYIADALYEIGMTGEAHRLLIGRDAELRRFSPDPFTKFSITKSRIMREREGWKEAASYLDRQIEHSSGAWGPRARAWLLAEAATLRLRSQGAAAADVHRADLQAIAKSVERKEGVCAEILGLSHEVQGRCLLRIAKNDEALLALDQANEYALRFRQLRSQLRISLLKAAAHYAKGEIDAVDALLVWSIETSQQRGIVRTFQDELDVVGKVIAVRAPHLKLSTTTRSYLDTLCAMGGTSPKTSRRAEKSSEEIFTKRELEIIDLLAGSMSNKRIALTFGISPATVKWNLQNIFHKLGVASRYDVITWARKHLPGTRQ